MRQNFYLSTLSFMLLASPYASAIHLWGSSATDHLVSLQAIAFIKEVPAHLKAIDDNEKKAKDDKEAASKAQNETLVLAKATLIERLKKLESAIAAEAGPAKREAESKKGIQKAKYQELLKKQDDDAEALREAEEKLEAEPSKWAWQKTGITQEEVDELEKELASTKKAVEALKIDLEKTAALEPSKELAQEVVIAQSALLGINAQLDSLAKSVALPADITKNYQTQRDEWKAAAVCMVKATHCTNTKKKALEAKDYDAIANLNADLARCATDTLAKASKATTSAKAESCHDVTVNSTTTKIWTCVQDYRANVLGKPETANSYAEYDPCAGKAPASLAAPR